MLHLIYAKEDITELNNESILLEFLDKYDVESCQELNENQVNLNFTLNMDDR